MDITNEQLTAKLTGFVNGLGRMTPKERQRNPTVHFVQDYNATREFALQLHPELAELFPPAVVIEGVGLNAEVGSNYGEILVYVQQLVGLTCENGGHFVA